MASLLLDAAAREVAAEALTWPDRARAADVTDTDSYTSAAELLLGIKALRDKVGETFNLHIQNAYRAHKDLVAEKAKAEAPLVEAERIIKRSLADYEQVQEQARQAEQKRLESEARRQAEADALAIAAALEMEGRRYGDEAMVLEAQAMLEMPVEPPPIAPVAKLTPKVAGISYRTTYAVQVMDLHALVKFVAANPSHLGLLSANMPALNAQARSLKEHLRIPGVVVQVTRDVAASGR